MSSRPLSISAAGFTSSLRSLAGAALLWSGVAAVISGSAPAASAQTPEPQLSQQLTQGRQWLEAKKHKEFLAGFLSPTELAAVTAVAPLEFWARTFEPMNAEYQTLFKTLEVRAPEISPDGLTAVFQLIKKSPFDVTVGTPSQSPPPFDPTRQRQPPTTGPNPTSPPSGPSSGPGGALSERRGRGFAPNPQDVPRVAPLAAVAFVKTGARWTFRDPMISGHLERIRQQAQVDPADLAAIESLIAEGVRRIEAANFTELATTSFVPASLKQITDLVPLETYAAAFGAQRGAQMLADLRYLQGKKLFRYENGTTVGFEWTDVASGKPMTFLFEKVGGTWYIHPATQNIPQVMIDPSLVKARPAATDTAATDVPKPAMPRTGTSRFDGTGAPTRPDRGALSGATGPGLREIPRPTRTMPEPRTAPEPRTSTATRPDDGDDSRPEKRSAEKKTLPTDALKVESLALPKGLGKYEYRKTSQNIKLESRLAPAALAAEIDESLDKQGWESKGRDAGSKAMVLRRTRGEATLSIHITPDGKGSNMTIFTKGLDWSAK